MLAAGAGDGTRGRSAEEGILDRAVVGADHVEIFGDGILAPEPHDSESLVAKSVHTEGCIVDIRVVERHTAQANKASGDIRKGDLRIAGRHIANMLVTGVQLQ